MELRLADFSSLKNAQNTENTLRAIDAGNKSQNISSVANSILTIGNGLYRNRQKAVEDEVQTQKASIRQELEQAIGGMNDLYSASLQNNSSYKNASSGEWVIAPDVIAYKNSCLSDIMGRADLSQDVKDWAQQELDSTFNSFNEIGERFTIQRDSQAEVQSLKTDMDKTLTLAVNTGNFDLFKETLRAHNIDPESKQGQLQLSLSKAEYDKGIFENSVRSTAMADGFAAASKLIESNNTLTAGDKDAFLTKAKQWSSNAQAVIADNALNVAKEGRKNGQSYQEILSTVLYSMDESEASEVNREIAFDAVQSVQMSECNSVVGLITNSMKTASKQGLDQLEQMLKENESLFKGLTVTSSVDGEKTVSKTYGGCMSLYDSTMEKIQAMKIDAVDYENKQQATFVKNLTVDCFNKFKAGQMSGQDCIDNIRATVTKLTGNCDAAEMECVNFLNSLKGVVPTELKSTYDDYFDDLKSNWFDLKGIDKKKFDADPELKAEFDRTKIFMQGAVADILMDCKNLSADEFYNKLKKKESALVGSYMDAEIQLRQGGISRLELSRKAARTEVDSALSLLNEFMDRNPVYYEQNSGTVDPETGETKLGVKWLDNGKDVNVKDQFENMATFFQDELIKMGLPIKSHDYWKNGNEVKAVPVFKGEDGKTYSINQNGNVVYVSDNGFMNEVVIKDGKVLNVRSEALKKVNQNRKVKQEEYREDYRKSFHAPNTDKQKQKQELEELEKLKKENPAEYYRRKYGDYGAR